MRPFNTNHSSKSARMDASGVPALTVIPRGQNEPPAGVVRVDPHGGAHIDLARSGIDDLQAVCLVLRHTLIKNKKKYSLWERMR